jgi:hypothetical protein
MYCLLDELKVWPATISCVCAALSALSAALWVDSGAGRGEAGAAAEATGGADELGPDFGSGCFEPEVPISSMSDKESISAGFDRSSGRSQRAASAGLFVVAPCKPEAEAREV